MANIVHRVLRAIRPCSIFANVAFKHRCTKVRLQLITHVESGGGLNFFFIFILFYTFYKCRIFFNIYTFFYSLLFFNTFFIKLYNNKNMQGPLDVVIRD